MSTVRLSAYAGRGDDGAGLLLPAQLDALLRCNVSTIPAFLGEPTAATAAKTGLDTGEIAALKTKLVVKTTALLMRGDDLVSCLPIRHLPSGTHILLVRTGRSITTRRAPRAAAWMRCVTITAQLELSTMLLPNEKDDRWLE